MRRQADVGAQLALELQQQPLGGLLADARDLHEPAQLLRGDGLRQLAHAHAREQAQRGARAHAGDLDELAEGRPLLGGAEAVENLRVFAHDEVREQRHLRADVGQVVERAHRHVDLVADAVAVHHHLRGVALCERAGQFAYHGCPFSLKCPA
ncbi:hypothetical protein D9M69_513970 [compost metagenome]